MFFLRRLQLLSQLLRHFGLRWVLFRVKYAWQVRTGSLKRKMPCASWERLPLGNFLKDPALSNPVSYHQYRQSNPPSFFFSPSDKTRYNSILSRWDIDGSPPVEKADRLLQGYLTFFSKTEKEVGFPPDWHKNAFTGENAPEDRHWSEIPDFGYGDIKVIWEPNRFGFTYDLVRAYWRTGDERYPEAFWKLIEDWRERNPPNFGVNWKCGQEIAFRVMAWCFGLYGFWDSPETTPVRVSYLVQMTAFSGQRVEDNIDYAISQQNNHGVSEAAGLWTIGLLFPELKAATRWKDMGAKYLESQARKLIYEDGSFAQHSMNYHRLMLHVFLWAIRLGQINRVELSQAVLGRIRKAGKWLLCVCDDENGRAPNMGANDGALILPVTDGDYPDYRPTIQAVGGVINGKAWLRPGPWDELAYWLGVEIRERKSAFEGQRPNNVYFADGGYAVLKKPGAMLLFRCPSHFIHRPSQCDLLHVDLWRRGVNLLRDGGSYSYNCETPWQGYFKSTAAHNTVRFDNHDQLLQLSRFLYGKWPALKVEKWLEGPLPGISAGFIDWKGCIHQRKIETTKQGWRITDHIEGFNSRAVLLWRLAPQFNWQLAENECSASEVTLRITCRPGPLSVQLVSGWESLYYFQKVKLPVLAVTVNRSPQELTSEIIFC